MPRFLVSSLPASFLCCDGFLRRQANDDYDEDDDDDNDDDEYGLVQLCNLCFDFTRFQFFSIQFFCTKIERSMCLQP